MSTVNINAFETAIKNYLDDFASKDKVFAEKYANPDKSIEKCCKYIYGEVRKALPKGSNAIGCAEEDIYGLAVHYYDEDDIKVEEVKAEVKVAQVPAASVKPSATDTPTKPKRGRKPKAQKTADDLDIPELNIPLFD